MTSPWEEEAIKGEKNRAAGLMGGGLLCVVTGAAGLGIGISQVFKRKEVLDTFQEGWKAANGGSAAFAVTMMYVAVAMSGIVIFAGLIGILANKKKNRPLAVAALAFIFVASVLQIVGAVLYAGLIDETFNILEPNPDTAGFDETQLALANFPNAVFNKCCVERFATDTSLDFEYSTGRTYRGDFQEELLDCAVEGCGTGRLGTVLGELSVGIPDINILLCGCFEPSAYDGALSYVESSNACEVLEDTEIDALELEIPVIDTKLNTLLQGTPYSPFLPIDLVAMTGYPGPEKGASSIPGVDPNQNFRCGLMYAKAVSWGQHLILDEAGGVAVLVFYGVASVQLLVIVLVVVFWQLGGGSDDDEWMAYDDGKVVNKPNPF